MFEGGAYGNAPGTSNALHDTCVCAGFESSQPSISMAMTVVIASTMDYRTPDFPFNKIRLLAINGSSTRGDIECGSIFLIRHALRCFPVYSRPYVLSSAGRYPRI